MSRTIPLTRGYVAIVDNEDYEWLSGYSWRAIGTQWVYAETRIPGVVRSTGKPKSVLMHRLILDLVDEPSHIFSDHIDGDTLNNRRSNLRITDNKGNQGNRRKDANSSSEYRGVVWNKEAGKWRARIRVNRKLRYIGDFDDEEEAALAYDIVARLHFEDFYALNLPERKHEHAPTLLTLLRRPYNTKERNPNHMLGVSKKKATGRWQAYVLKDGKQKHVGTFSTQEEAAIARARYINSQCTNQ